MRVLFATDGSDCADGAAKVLSDMQFQTPVDLNVLMVTYNPETFSAGRIQPWFPEWQAHEKKRVQQQHERLRELFGDKIGSWTATHRTGTIAYEIVQEAQSFEADLIVLGARGHSLIGRIFLGSVSDHVATHAGCSVLIIRPPNLEGETSHLPRKITIAYDGSVASKDAVEEIEKIRWGAATQFNVLTVAPYYDYLLGDGMSSVILEDEQEMFEEMRAAAQEVSEKIGKGLPQAEAETVRGHHVGDTIVNQAEKSGSELIVVGDTGHSMIEDWLIGSTTKYVLRHAPCSVWISRHHRRATDPERSTEQSWAVT